MEQDHLETDVDTNPDQDESQGSIDGKIQALELQLQTDYQDAIANHDPAQASALNQALNRLEHPDITTDTPDVQYVTARSGDESDTINPESEHKSSVEQTIEDAKGIAMERAVEAIERSEFSGPEVEGAIKGFYVDHEVALKLIGTLVEGSTAEAATISNLDGESLGIESELLRSAVQKLAQLRTEQKDDKFNELAETVCHDALFREPCVGQSTLTDETIKQAVEEVNRLQKSLYSLQEPYAKKPRLIDEGWIRQSMEDAHNEVRSAGQLLFHNTPYGLDISTGNASLRGRAKQKSSVLAGEQKSVRMVTSDNEGHSDNIHWSELYDPISYKTINMRTPGIEQVAPDKVQGVTFAVPLAEVIEHAPIARGIKYAVVEGKPGAESINPEDVRGSAIGDVGRGEPDAIGSRASIDRVFWATTDTRETAMDYEIPLSGGVDNSVYTIQSGVNRLWNYRYRRENIVEGTDEEKQLQEDARTLPEKDFLDKYGAGILVQGSAKETPTAVFIDDLRVPSSTQTALEAKIGGESVIGMDIDNKDRVSRETMVATAEPVIRRLQAESRQRFDNQYVVPLRAVYAGFMNSGDNRVNKAYGEDTAQLLGRL
jgi:hypothetical protein